MSIANRYHLHINMISKNPAVDDRRPQKVRSARWAKWIAQGLASRGVTPNQISVASIAFAGAAAGCMLAGGWLLIGAALCIQARLLCNLFDGMVAVEHGKTTPLGALYNEFPDRLADSMLFVAAGYVAGMFWLGCGAVSRVNSLCPRVWRCVWPSA